MFRAIILFFYFLGGIALWEPNEKLINEYELNLKESRKEKSKRADLKEKFKEYDQLDQWTNKMEVELKLISGMVSNMEYSIYWMKNGVERTRVRGVSNMSHDQRVEYWGDISEATSYYHISEEYLNGFDVELSEEDDKKIEKYISCLAKREREAFMYIVIEGHTYEKAALYMGISRSAVQTMIIRSKVKIKKLLNTENKDENTELIKF